MVEWPNDSFNLTTNVPALVLGDVSDAFKTLADPEDIIAVVDPTAANVEDIQTQRSTPLGAQLYQLTIGIDLTPQEFWNKICVHILNMATLHASYQNVVI